MTAIGVTQETIRVENAEITVELVTPEMAVEILTKNTHNRSVRRSKIRALVVDLRDGAWKFNGDAIRIAGDGTLVDGQHRLEACIKADTRFLTVVVRGLDMEVQTTVDRGSARSFRDDLAIAGIPQYSLIAPIVTKVNSVEQQGVWSPTGGGYHTATSHELHLRYHADVEGFAAAAKVGEAVKKSRLLPGGIAGAIFYQFAKANHDDAVVFFRTLISGADLAQDDAILHLRNRLERARSTKTIDAISREMRIALTIKAFNYWRAGRKIEYLTVKLGGARRESFPEVESMDWDDIGNATGPA